MLLFCVSILSVYSFFDLRVCFHGFLFEKLFILVYTAILSMIGLSYKLQLILYFLDVLSVCIMLCFLSSIKQKNVRANIVCLFMQKVQREKGFYFFSIHDFLWETVHANILR